MNDYCQSQQMNVQSPFIATSIPHYAFDPVHTHKRDSTFHKPTLNFEQFIHMGTIASLTGSALNGK